MKRAVSFAILVLFMSVHTRAETNSCSLIDVNSADFGDTNSLMRMVELERNANTSTLRLTYKEMGSSVWSSIFIMSAFCEVAKARGTEYFINLKEWDDPQGGRLYIGGFTNTKDADIKKEFGDEFDATNEYDQARDYMSVTECGMFFDGPGE